MRLAHVLVLLAAATAAAAAALTVPSVGRWVGLGQARADSNSTLYISGLDIGPGRKAIVRLRNTSTHASDILSVNYTVRDPSIQACGTTSGCVVDQRPEQRGHSKHPLRAGGMVATEFWRRA